MSTAQQVFEKNRQAGNATLIGYFPLGFPTVEQSIDACVAMCETGVDILELGIPYSDPVMDGLVIQEATNTALNAGFKLVQTFDAIRRITARVDTPVLVMSYWNPILQYGVERFARELSASGAAGLITPDLIPDEAADWIAISNELGLERVFLATPSSSESRTAAASNSSRGFVYAVSTMGITGAREDLDAAARSVVSKIRKSGCDQNIGVGIGVSTREQVLEISQYADAAIVGSVFVKSYQTAGLNGLRSKVKEIAGR